MIEEYDEDGCIELIGLAELTIEGLKYTERYNDAPLFLSDLVGLTEAQVKQHISEEYSEDIKNLENVEILIAYESVGDWGCDSSSFFLIRIDGVLYENHGSHCSCYGFEGQWSPEETKLQYLKSPLFTFSIDEYDDQDKENMRRVLKYLKDL